MSVVDNRKEWTLFDTCTYYYIKLIGLWPFEIAKDNSIRKSHLGLFYNVLISILYTYTFTLAIYFRKAIILWEETPIAVIIDLIGSILSYSVVSTSWLVVACRQKAALELIESFREIENLRKELRVINSKSSLQVNLSTFKRQFLFLNVIIFIVVNFSVIFTSLCQDLQNHTTFWFLYNLPRDIFFIVPFIMVKIMIFIRDQSNLLNRELLEIFKNDQLNRAVERVSQKMFKLESLAKLHATLMDHYEKVVNYFGPSILITLLCSLNEVILPIHAVWQIFKKLKWGTLNTACVVFNPLIKFLSHAIVLFFICSIPDSTCLQINKTVLTVHRLWNENEQIVDRNKMKQIILHFSQSQLKPQIFGFLCLDYNLLQSICMTAMSYLIFMFQLDSAKPE